MRLLVIYVSLRMPRNIKTDLCIFHNAEYDVHVRLMGNSGSGILRGGGGRGGGGYTID